MFVNTGALPQVPQGTGIVCAVAGRSGDPSSTVTRHRLHQERGREAVEATATDQE